MLVGEQISRFLISFFSESPDEKRRMCKNFGRWLFRVIVKYFVIPLIVVLILASILGILPDIDIVKIKKSLSDSEVRFISSIIQAVFIFLVILIPVKEKLFFIGDIEKKEREKKIMSACGYNNGEKKDKEAEKAEEKKRCDAMRIANSALRQYKTRWYLIWVFWLLLYLTLCLKYWPGGIDLPKPALSLLLNLFNNASTLMFIVCYLTLAKVTITDDRTKVTETPNWIPWATIFLVITFLDIVSTVTGSAAKPPSFDYGIIDSLQGILGVGWPLFYAPFKIGLLIYPGPPDINFINMIGGLGAGVVMAMFVGRFDSKFINAPLLLLISLYGYAVLQALFFLLPGERLSIFIINAAFIFKILLFLFMCWLFKSGKLLFYFVRIRRLHYEIEGQYYKEKGDWEEFLELFHDLEDTSQKEPNNKDSEKGSSGSLKDKLAKLFETFIPRAYRKRGR